MPPRKGGVVNLTRQIAVDFGPRGIICNAIAPGKILTAPADEPDTPEMLAYSHARTPFPRLGRPEDVASLARLPRLGRLHLHERRERDGRRRLDGLLSGVSGAGTARATSSRCRSGA